MRVRQLEDEAGLAHTGLAHDRRDLTAALPGLLERAAELLDLGVTAEEPGEPTGSRGLEA
jgi:hypothetical protein